MKTMKIIAVSYCLLSSPLTLPTEKPVSTTFVEDFRNLQKQVSNLQLDLNKQKLISSTLTSAARSTRNGAVLLLVGAYFHSIATNSQDLTHPELSQEAFLAGLENYKNTIQNTGKSLHNYGQQAQTMINNTYESYLKNNTKKENIVSQNTIDQNTVIPVEKKNEEIAENQGGSENDRRD